MIEDYRRTYSEKYGVDLSGMVPFGENGDLFVCLDYRADPETPSVWKLCMDEDDGSEDGYYQVAHSVDAFLEALRPS